MSKTKEQCIKLINEKLYSLEDSDDFYLQLAVVEEMIKEISGSEYGVLCLYNKKNRSISHFSKKKEQHTLLESSIVQEVLSSKKGFFDNHVVSHKHYNSKIDNPLGIKLKSLLVVPILTQQNEEEVVGLFFAINGVDSSHEFKRYDVRCLGFLNSSVLMILSRGHDKQGSRREERLRSEENKLTLLHTKVEEQERKIKELEEQLQKGSVSGSMSLTTEAYNKRDDATQLHTILSFLTNEVTYLANEEHKIYLFLEIIKNSLHNREQLHFINGMLDKSHLVPKLANELYTREKMPLLLEEFNLFQLVDDLASIYGKIFSEKGVTFNVYLDPLAPTYLISEMLKIKSLIVHLLNNVYGLVEEQGVVEFMVKYEDEFLNIELKTINNLERKGIQNFFKSSAISHSLTSSDSGLGLSVGSNIINILGGKLKLATLENKNHSFLASIPVKEVTGQKEKYFIPKSVIKVVLLISEENQASSKNLLRYFRHLGVQERNIRLTSTLKEIRGERDTYLFCFDNMLPKVINANRFLALVILKHRLEEIDERRVESKNIYQFYLNGYYGIGLQHLFFPEVTSHKLVRKTLLTEDTFLNKFNNMVKKLKLI